MTGSILERIIFGAVEGDASTPKAFDVNAAGQLYIVACAKTAACVVTPLLCDAAGKLITTV